MSSIGDFSHIFLTRIKRDFPLQSPAISRGAAPVKMAQNTTRESNRETPIDHLSGESELNPSTAAYSGRELVT